MTFGAGAIGNNTASNGYDNASGIGLNRNRMVRTGKLDLFFFGTLIFDTSDEMSSWSMVQLGLDSFLLRLT